MRILFSTHHRHDPDSGASGTTLTVSGALARRGHEISTISFDDLPRMGERKAALAYPWRVARALGKPDQSRFDVIDSSLGDTWIWGMRGRTRPRPLLVLRSHGLEHLYYRATLDYERRHGTRPSLKYRAYGGHWRLLEVARSLRQADLVLTLNDEERQFAIDELGVEPDRLEFVGNPIGEEMLSAAATVNQGDPTGIAYVGDWRPLKGVEYGCAAAVEILRHAPEATISFVGVGGAGEEILASFPAEQHERIRIVPTYRREALPELLEGSGIMLFPSLSEGFGNVLVETMACGLTPVAARSGGAAQIVEDGVDGLLVPRYGVEEMTAAVLRLLRDARLRGRLRAAARRSAQSYALDRIAERTLELYRAGLARRQAEIADGIEGGRRAR